MSYSIPSIVSNTEALLKLRHDETLTSTTPQRLHDCLGQAVMMALNQHWTNSKKAREGHRKAYYFSAEYLMGRLVYSNLFNMGILEPIRKAFAEKGVDLAELEDIEDAALGNGGLGRLAACFLDSAVTKGVPLSGYGLRYRFGLFKQSFGKDGSQKESADDWTRYGDPWSYRRDKHAVQVSFADQTVIAVPYDMPIIGYGNDNIGTLRLWQCEPQQELDFDAFNAQDYEKALLEKNKAEDITRNGDIFELTVGYLEPDSQWLQSIKGEKSEPTPSKYMIYQLQKVDDHYQLIAIQDPPEGAVPGIPNISQESQQSETQTSPAGEPQTIEPQTIEPAQTPTEETEQTEETAPTEQQTEESESAQL